MSIERRILKAQDTVLDGWRYPGEEAAAENGVVLPLADLLTKGASGEALPARLGVLLAPADAVEALVPFLDRVQLVVATLPGPGEGRPFTQGRLLRQRYHFTGELRARGAAVKQDRIFLLARCGFDAFELAAGENEDEDRRALQRYTVGYQDGDAQVLLRRRA